MLRGNRRVLPREFAPHFTFSRSAFRLLVLDSYEEASEEEPYRQHASGLEPDPAWAAGWTAEIAEATAAGKNMQRVHVLSEPLSAYARFALTCGYPASAAAGEDIRILPRSLAGASGPGDLDFWLFDSERAALMHYDSRGTLRWLRVTSSPRVVARCCRVRDAALFRSVPLDRYLQQAGLTGHVPMTAGGR
jgi:hypothetical protein